MECREARDLLPAYVDSELGVGEALALDSHLQHCADCREHETQQKSLRSALRANARYFNAPATLAKRIDAALPAMTPPPRALSARPLVQWWQFGGVAALVAAIAWSVGLYTMLPSVDDRIADEV